MTIPQNGSGPPPARGAGLSASEVNNDAEPSDATPVGAREIAARLGVDAGTVTKWRRRGLLPAHRWIVSGQRAWSWPDVEEWARATGRLDPEN